MKEEFEKAKAVLERLIQATGAANDSALSNSLGVSSQAVYDAKKRGKVPDAWIRIIADKYAVSADWLLFGRGAMQPRTDGELDGDSGLKARIAALEAKLREKDETIDVLLVAMKTLHKKDKLEMASHILQDGQPDLASATVSPIAALPVERCVKK